MMTVRHITGGVVEGGGLPEPFEYFERAQLYELVGQSVHWFRDIWMDEETEDEVWMFTSDAHVGKLLVNVELEGSPHRGLYYVAKETFKLIRLDTEPMKLDTDEELESIINNL